MALESGALPTVWLTNDLLGSISLSTQTSIVIPKFYIAPYDKINHGLVNLSYNSDVKSGLSFEQLGPHLSMITVIDENIPVLMVNYFQQYQHQIQGQDEIETINLSENLQPTVSVSHPQVSTMAAWQYQVGSYIIFM